ncbi:MAG: NAD-dependent epimerase/dehydratase family protein [Actinomycetota bacterium]|nr:NAD-dependent epimerase/dehydratase family protein [Actinomycetota bacterium]
MSDAGDCRVVVTGASGALGRRTVAALASSCTVIGIDRRPWPFGVVPAPAEHHVGDLTVIDLDERFAGADVIVHLASAAPDTDVDLEADRRVVAAAGRRGVAHLVVVSSATVYGARPDNPVPLTEEHVLRPTASFAYAVVKAELERVTAEWRRSGPGRTATVLRPTLTVASAEHSWLARVFHADAPVRASPTDPPVQFLHYDDLAAAVALAVAVRPDGSFNVAPDGWMSGARFQELIGPAPRVRIAEPVAAGLAAVGWRSRLTDVPPGLVRYGSHPWVVANDRLRGLGWEPSFSNEEAYVAAHEANPLTELTPKRRQELALSVAGGSILALVLAAVAVAWRVWFRGRGRS